MFVGREMSPKQWVCPRGEKVFWKGGGRAACGQDSVASPGAGQRPGPQPSHGQAPTCIAPSYTSAGCKDDEKLYVGWDCYLIMRGCCHALLWKTKGSAKCLVGKNTATAGRRSDLLRSQGPHGQVLLSLPIPRCLQRCSLSLQSLFFR